VLTSGLDPDSPIPPHAALHGDGVKDVAFRVKNVDSAFRTAVRRGATTVSPPQVHEDERGRLVRATIGAPGAGSSPAAPRTRGSRAVPTAPRAHVGLHPSNARITRPPAP
jgi:hypothetical protein